MVRCEQAAGAVSSAGGVVHGRRVGGQELGDGAVLAAAFAGLGGALVAFLAGPVGANDAAERPGFPFGDERLELFEGFLLLGVLGPLDGAGVGFEGGDRQLGGPDDALAATGHPRPASWGCA